MTTDKRVASLDILRGLALLGMFAVHFHDHSTEPGGLDDAVRTLIWRLVESKSHGTFALLFGAGFAIQLRRAETLGRPFAVFYLRRLAVLALFGLARMPSLTGRLWFVGNAGRMALTNYLVQICRRGSVQHGLARALPIRPGGVALEVAHLWSYATDAG